MKDNSKINLWWWQGVNNFGDQVNPYLIKHLSGKNIKYTEHIKLKGNLTSKIRTIASLYYRKGILKASQILYSTFFKQKLFCIGSIIELANETCRIWGAGLISKDGQIKSHKIYAVRGKYTYNKAIKQTNKTDIALGDPALLLPLIYKSQKIKKYQLGIIPHYVDYELLNTIITDPRIRIIDLRTNNIEKVIDEINECEQILSSSLHGIIVSHTYNIPALWIKLSSKLEGDDIKFYDYFSSVNISEYKPITIVKNDFNTLILLFQQFKSYVLPTQDIISERCKGLLKCAPFPINFKYLEKE